MYLLALSVGTALLLGGLAVAQPGPQMPVEKQQQVWQLQAQSAAGELGLSEEEGSKLAEAYKASRESQNEALRAKMSEGGQPGWGAFREVNEAERAKFETALKEFLTEEQASKALVQLGAFNRRWDPMVSTLSDLKLEANTMTDAMKALNAYVVESHAAAPAAGERGDREAARQKATELREKLNAEMSKILPEEAYKQWEAATPARGMRGGGGMGGGGMGGGGMGGPRSAPPADGEGAAPGGPEAAAPEADAAGNADDSETAPSAQE